MRNSRDLGILSPGRISSDSRGNQQMKNEAKAKAKEKSENSDIQQVWTNLSNTLSILSPAKKRDKI